MTNGAQPNPTSRIGRIFRNAGALVGGKAVGGVLSLAYLAIAARTLGPTEMGYFVLAHAYAVTVAGLARFQSWQAVIRFGAPMMDAGDREGVKRLIRYTVKLDLFSALLAIAVAAGAAGLVQDVLGWPDEAMPLVYAYCLTTPFLIAATPTGILRLFDCFKVLGWQLSLSPAVRFVGAIIAWALGGGLEAFLAVWIISGIVDGASLWILGACELRRQDLWPGWRSSTQGRPASREWLPFMLRTNLTSSIELMTQQVPLLVVGGVLGGAAAGFYQVGRNVANLLNQLVNMLNQASYPELARVHASAGVAGLRSLAGRSIAVALAAAAPLVAAMVVFRAELAVLVGGDAFAPAGVVIGLLAVAQLLRVAAVILESTILAMGRAGYVLGSNILAAAALTAGLVAGLPWAGLAAAPLAIMLGWSMLAARYIYALVARAA